MFQALVKTSPFSFASLYVPGLSTSVMIEFGDLELRLRQDNRGRHKLSPPWEGPYIIAEVLKPGTYKLANENGEVFTNAWNI